MASSQYTTTDPRLRHRVPCSLRIRRAGDLGQAADAGGVEKLGDEEHRAMVLNLSKGGLFVRTTARARRGDRVEIDLSLEDAAEPVVLAGDVVWRRISNSTVSHMTDGGFGLRLRSSPEAYEHFLDELGDKSAGEAKREAQGVHPAEPTPVDACELTPFEVLLKLRGSPRSRCLRLDAENNDAATEQALAQAGAEWEVLEVRPKAPRT